MNDLNTYTAGLIPFVNTDKKLRLQINRIYQNYVISLSQDKKLSIVEHDLAIDPLQLLKALAPTSVANFITSPVAAIPLSLEGAKNLIKVLQEYVDAETKEEAVNNGN